MSFLWIITFVYFSSSLFAKNYLRLPDTRSIGIGGNGVTQSALLNPAVVELLADKSVELNYFNLYGLEELSSINISFNNPNPYFSFAFNISSFGYDEYRDSMFRLSFGKALSDKWALGVSAQCLLLQTLICEEDVKRLSADVGVLYFPVENVLIGLLISDITSVRLTDENPNVKRLKYCSIHLGIQYYVSNVLLITASARYENEESVVAAFGLEYIPYDNFSIRAGIQSTSPAFGVGYKFSAFTVNAAFVYNSIIGINSGVGIAYSF
jgi:hypothetical protein